MHYSNGILAASMEAKGQDQKEPFFFFVLQWSEQKTSTSQGEARGIGCALPGEERAVGRYNI